MGREVLGSNYIRNQERTHKRRQTNIGEDKAYEAETDKEILGSIGDL